MSAMYEAMKKAAEKNAKFNYELKKAQENINAKKEKARLMKIQQQANEKARIEDLRARAEKERRETEQKLMAILKPFSFSYSWLGPYSRTVGVILANDIEDAKRQIEERLTASMEMNVEFSPKSLSEVRLVVEPMDLSDGYCTVYDHIE